jgi:hypothetical protein
MKFGGNNGFERDAIIMNRNSVQIPIIWKGIRIKGKEFPYRNMFTFNEKTAVKYPL